MKKSGFIFLGILLLGAGLLFLISAFFDISFWSLAFPMLLIMIGVVMLIRPRLDWAYDQTKIRPILEIDRDGEWEVGNSDTWSFVADIALDFSNAKLPDGETAIRFMGFVGDLDITIPETCGLSISSAAFLTESRINTNKRQTFFSPLNYTSENYQTSQKKIRIETLFFVNELKVSVSHGVVPIIP